MKPSTLRAARATCCQRKYPNYSISARCLDLALKAHQALGCRGVSRSDFRYDEKEIGEQVYFLEINTQPGMTGTSLVPEQAAHLGISFPDLCGWLIEDASCQR